ncbi:hypothetical protein F5B19DRAFT_502783 [Rostrohypoxylon terebratum]|nr:hypothetical protein F5B19DRAFT_502783 [Rostrohypoxylon terebratum]
MDHSAGRRNLPQFSHYLYPYGRSNLDLMRDSMAPISQPPHFQPGMDIPPYPFYHPTPYMSIVAPDLPSMVNHQYSPPFTPNYSPHYTPRPSRPQIPSTIVPGVENAIEPGSHVRESPAIDLTRPGIPTHTHPLRQTHAHNCIPYHASGGAVTKFGSIANGPRPNSISQAPKQPKTKHPELEKAKVEHIKANQPESKQPEATKPEAKQAEVQRAEVQQTENKKEGDQQEEEVVPDLPYNLGHIWLENRRMSAKREMREAKELAEKAERTTPSQPSTDQSTTVPTEPTANTLQTTESTQDTHLTQSDPSTEYIEPWKLTLTRPAQVTEVAQVTQPTPTTQPSPFIQGPLPLTQAPRYTHNLPNSQAAVHVGTVQKDRTIHDVYAIRKQRQHVEFRAAPCGSTLDEIHAGPHVRFDKIDLSPYFNNMTKDQISLWVNYLPDIVPGRNDELMRWL